MLNITKTVSRLAAERFVVCSGQLGVDQMMGMMYNILEMIIYHMIYNLPEVIGQTTKTDKGVSVGRCTERRTYAYI